MDPFDLRLLQPLPLEGGQRQRQSGSENESIPPRLMVSLADLPYQLGLLVVRGTRGIKIGVHSRAPSQSKGRPTVDRPSPLENVNLVGTKTAR